MKRFLITTAEESTWRSDCPVLFLGEWCRLYDRRAVWDCLDAEVAPYHWDDRRRYKADCSRLVSVYEELLRRTSAALNQEHGADRSRRYWRIVVGPWLYMFTHVLFDRWTMIQEAQNTYDIEGTLLLDLPLTALIPPFLSGPLFQDMRWNHYVYGRALEHQRQVQCQRIQVPERRSARSEQWAASLRRRSASVVARDAVVSLLARFTRSNDAMVIHSYLPRLAEIKLQLSLGQLPKHWPVPRMKAVPPDPSRRSRFTVASDTEDAFMQFATAMVSDLIPTVYLEGYESLRETAQRLPWPSRPKVVFTSNLFLNCEVFQEWAASKCEAGHPFVIGQHGGLAGVGQHVQGEDHQVGISDRYLTWGWTDGRPQPYPAAILTNVGRSRGAWKSSGDLLLVTAPIQLFSFRSMSCPVGANQSISFVKEQVRFAKALDKPALSRLSVRITADRDRALGTGYVERWKREVPGVDVDPSTTPIDDRLAQCRVFVYTYNGTGFLETLARNIPTVMFWNPWYFELRSDAQPFFDLLATAHVFHDTPESAAHHVNEVWDDVSQWWNETTVQQARRTFCEKYARMPQDPLRVLRDALLTAPVLREQA